MSIPSFVGATEIRDLVCKREVSCADVVRMYGGRIAAYNSKINAIVHFDLERSLAEALALDASIAEGAPVGPLVGVPITVKDLFEVAGMPATAGTAGRINYVPSRDATVVERLRRAGAIVIGKSNVPEFGMCLETTNELFGTTNNPYDLTCTAGGSSGGAAAAVAAGLSALDVGSDGGGSIRLPSHFCGVAGFKATSHRISKAGHFPAHTGMASRQTPGYGPLARSVRDLSIAFDVIIGADPRDPDALPSAVDLVNNRSVTELRVAFYTDNGIRSVSPETTRVVERAAAALSALGARVVPQRLPRLEDAFEIHLALLVVDRWLVSEWKALSGTKALHPWVQAGVEYLDDAALESDFTSNTPTMLHDDWYEYRRDATLFMQDFDVVLSPVAPGPALPHGELTSGSNFDWCSYVSVHNVTGWPAAVVRAGTSAEGLPIGVQVAGPAFSDRLVLQVSALLEHELGGFESPPAFK